MRTGGIHFNRETKYWFYGVFGVLFFSGIFWLVIHYFYDGQIEFDSPPAVWKPVLMKVHGAAAMAALVVLGVLIPIHMQRAWRKKRNLFTAVILVSLSILMILSGYGLYYCGDDVLRFWVSGIHNTIGCFIPLVLLWHIVSGRKERMTLKN